MSETLPTPFNGWQPFTTTPAPTDPFTLYFATPDIASGDCHFGALLTLQNSADGLYLHVHVTTEVGEELGYCETKVCLPRSAIDALERAYRGTTEVVGLHRTQYTAFYRTGDGLRTRTFSALNDHLARQEAMSSLDSAGTLTELWASHTAMEGNEVICTRALPLNSFSETS